MQELRVPPISAPSRRAVALVAFGWFLAALAFNWLGNWGHSLWDRDEPRYAVATREMIAGGDWIVPYFNGDYRFDKPILIYWLMSVPMRWLGVNEFAARAASGVAGATTVVLVFLFALRMGACRSGAHVAALVAALSPLLFVTSKAATTDAVLILTVVGALTLHWEQLRRGFSWPRHLAFWVIVGLSVLEKGPPGPLVIGLTVAGERMWRAIAAWRSKAVTPSAAAAAHARAGNPAPPAGDPASPPTFTGKTVALGAFRFVIGLVVFFAVTLPWAWAAWEATNGAFFRVAVGRHVIERAATSLESHGGPLVYYIPVLFLGLFPFTAALLTAVRWGWSARRAAPLRLLWCWLVPSFLIFSFAKTKLPHYVSPLAPAAALMIGLWWTARSARRQATGASIPETSTCDAPPAGAAEPSPGWWRAGAMLTALFGVVAGVALPVAAALGPFPQILAPGCVMALVLAVSSVTGGVLWWRRGAEPALAAWTSGMLTAAAVGLLWALPALEPLRPSKPLAAWVRANAPSGTELLAVEYQEPSLVFYRKGYVEMLGKGEEEKGLARLSDLDRPATLVTTETRWQRWLDRFDGALPDAVGVLFQEKYYLFQKGQWERLVIVGNWKPPSEPSADHQAAFRR